VNEQAKKARDEGADIDIQNDHYEIAKDICDIHVNAYKNGFDSGYSYRDDEVTALRERVRKIARAIASFTQGHLLSCECDYCYLLQEIEAQERE
jgi:hypothetical protein